MAAPLPSGGHIGKALDPPRARTANCRSCADRNGTQTCSCRLQTFEARPDLEYCGASLRRTRTSHPGMPSFTRGHGHLDGITLLPLRKIRTITRRFDALALLRAVFSLSCSKSSCSLCETISTGLNSPQPWKSAFPPASSPWPKKSLLLSFNSEPQSFSNTPETSFCAWPYRAHAASLTLNRR